MNDAVIISIRTRTRSKSGILAIDLYSRFDDDYHISTWPKPEVLRLSIIQISREAPPENIQRFNRLNLDDLLTSTSLKFPRYNPVQKFPIPT